MIKYIEAYSSMPFSGMEKNKNVLYEGLWSDPQDTSLGEKSEVQNTVCSVLSFVFLKGVGQDQVCPLICKCLKYLWEGTKELVTLDLLWGALAG